MLAAVVSFVKSQCEHERGKTKKQQGIIFFLNQSTLRAQGDDTWTSYRMAVQKYFVGLVYPMSLNTDINLKPRLFTDNLSPVLTKTRAMF